MNALRALSEEEVEASKCHWEETNDMGIAWKTECGEKYSLPNFKYLLPSSEDFKYCPFCGHEIKLGN